MSEGFFREPLLTKEQEMTLKSKITCLWKEGHTAKEIARHLRFGAKKPYIKLKTYHVWYYRRKFNLKPRIKRKGGNRYKVSPNELELPIWDDFKKLLETLDYGDPFFIQRKLAYLILTYHTPLRKSEIIEREIEDFEIIDINGQPQDLTFSGEKLYLKINLVRKKKGENAKGAPCYVSLNEPGMDEVLSYLSSNWLQYGTSKPFEVRPETARAARAASWSPMISRGTRATGRTGARALRFFLDSFAILLQF